MWSKVLWHSRGTGTHHRVRRRLPRAWPFPIADFRAVRRRVRARLPLWRQNFPAPEPRQEIARDPPRRTRLAKARPVFLHSRCDARPPATAEEQPESWRVRSRQNVRLQRAIILRASQDIGVLVLP